MRAPSVLDTHSACRTPPRLYFFSSQVRSAGRVAARRAVVVRAADAEQVLADVRSIIAEQLGTDVDSVTVSTTPSLSSGMATFSRS